MSNDLRLRAIQSTLDLERVLAARTAHALTEAQELLRQAAAQFREHERHHLAKSPPDEAKAQRNASMAARIEAHLSRQPEAATDGR
jgi:hypothetical protein